MALSEIINKGEHVRQQYRNSSKDEMLFIYCSLATSYWAQYRNYRMKFNGRDYQPFWPQKCSSLFINT